MDNQAQIQALLEKIEKNSRKQLFYSRMQFICTVALTFGCILILVKIGQFLPQLLGADPSVQADARAYFCIVGAFLPFAMAVTARVARGLAPRRMFSLFLVASISFTAYSITGSDMYVAATAS